MSLGLNAVLSSWSEGDWIPLAPGQQWYQDGTNITSDCGVAPPRVPGSRRLLHWLSWQQGTTGLGVGESCQRAGLTQREQDAQVASQSVREAEGLRSSPEKLPLL